MSQELVQITESEFNLKLDLVYASSNNVTGGIIYQNVFCAIHKDVAPLVKLAAQHAKRAGYTLVVFDGYRPRAAQEKLWQAIPDPLYIVPPEIGSNHTRGTAIDVTLIDDETGLALDMGTGFDDMTTASHHNYDDLPLIVQRHRLVLLGIMLHAGFKEIASEWWHYELPGGRAYPQIQSDLVKV